MKVPPELSTSLVGDVLDRLQGMHGLKRYDTGGIMVGRALTVRTRPGDNLAITAAIPTAKSGDILVVDGSGDESVALAGEILMNFAIRYGLRGLVVDGAVRDVDDFANQSEFGCFARGVSLRGPSKNGPGEVNVPVCVAGQVVQPGDIIIGDSDGVIAVPAQEYDEIVSAAIERHTVEQNLIRAIRSGEENPLPIEKMLAAASGKVVIHD